MINNKYVFSFALSLLTFILSPQSSFAACEKEDSYADQSIVLSIDISTSINKDEAILQFKGYQDSLLRQGVQDKLLGCGCTELSVIVFASESKTIVPPKLIVDESDILEVIDAFTTAINESESDRYLSSYFGLGGGTSVVDGLQGAMDIILRPDNAAIRKAILVSGDGVNDIFAERKLNNIKKESENNIIEITGVPVISESNLNLCSKYEESWETNTGIGGCSSEENIEFGGSLIPKSSLNTPNSYTYDSITDFYERFVANKFGEVKTAASFDELSSVLSETIERMACKPMM